MGENILERQRFGQIIVQLRKEKKLSQKGLAELAETTQNNIYRIENGKYCAGLDVLIRVGKALGKELNYI